MARRLGIVGRSDHGGLAAQSLAVAQHLDPSAALVLDMEGRGRGTFNITPWVEALGHERVRVATFPFSDGDLHWLFDRSDVIFAAEGPPPGRDDFPNLCSGRGVEFVIHVNPELWRDSYRGPSTKLALPTSWHAGRFPESVALPMPVDTKRFPFRQRTQARHFLHVTAPAFHDRNGSDLLRAALPLVRSPVKFTIHGVTTQRETGRVGNVELHFTPATQDQAGIYPPDADVLILPRRYGGQSLTMNEAAALGMPIITLDLAPQNERPGMHLVKPFLEPPHQHMIGGQEAVHDTDPAALALAIDLLVENDGIVQNLSARAGEWARVNSWKALLPRWQEVLGL